jgi:hypothetical protein
MAGQPKPVLQMHSTARAVFRWAISTRARSTAATTAKLHKPSGDISAVFPSLSGKKLEPLPDRFRELKRQYIRGKEEALTTSWHRLLARLQDEMEEIRVKGSSVSHHDSAQPYFWFSCSLAKR